jgi:hypothetical protein
MENIMIVGQKEKETYYDEIICPLFSHAYELL